MSKHKPQLPQLAFETRWRQAFASKPPPLVPGVAASLLSYREQEQAEGGLSRQALRALEALQIDRTGGKATQPAPRYKSGVRLMRTWKDRTFVVTITPQGYLFEGREYTSLSRIAKEITGTTWSGPAFFGVKKRASKEQA